MVSDTLGSQLRRIGALPALAVLIATALATFALLGRLVPPSVAGSAPQTIKPAQAVPPPATAAPVSATADGSSDLLNTSSWARAERAIRAAQRRELQLVRRNAAAVRRGFKPVSVPRLGAVTTIKRAGGSSAPSPPPAQSNQRHKPSGGVSELGSRPHS